MTIGKTETCAAGRLERQAEGSALCWDDEGRESHELCLFMKEKLSWGEAWGVKLH